MQLVISWGGNDCHVLLTCSFVSSRQEMCCFDSLVFLFHRPKATSPRPDHLQSTSSASLQSTYTLIYFTNGLCLTCFSIYFNYLKPTFLCCFLNKRCLLFLFPFILFRNFYFPRMCFQYMVFNGLIL